MRGTSGEDGEPRIPRPRPFRPYPDPGQPSRRCVQHRPTACTPIPTCRSASTSTAGSPRRKRLGCTSNANDGKMDASTALAKPSNTQIIELRTNCRSDPARHHGRTISTVHYLRRRAQHLAKTGDPFGQRRADIRGLVAVRPRKPFLKGSLTAPTRSARNFMNHNSGAVIGLFAFKVPPSTRRALASTTITSM